MSRVNLVNIASEFSYIASELLSLVNSVTTVENY